jgi:hypothetical protein
VVEADNATLASRPRRSQVRVWVPEPLAAGMVLIRPCASVVYEPLVGRLAASYVVDTAAAVPVLIGARSGIEFQAKVWVLVAAETAGV